MWNHNNHFHNYLLRQLPRKVKRVLDIGCGLGVFAQRLAERSELVEALDVDKAILEEASNLNSAPNICYRQADFLEANLSEESGRCDRFYCFATPYGFRDSFNKDEGASSLIWKVINSWTLPRDNDIRLSI